MVSKSCLKKEKKQAYVNLVRHLPKFIRDGPLIQNQEKGGKKPQKEWLT